MAYAKMTKQFLKKNSNITIKHYGNNEISKGLCYMSYSGIDTNNSKTLLISGEI